MSSIPTEIKEAIFPTLLTQMMGELVCLFSIELSIFCIKFNIKVSFQIFLVINRSASLETSKCN